MTDFITTRFETPDGITIVGDVGGPAGAPAVILSHGGGQTRHSWSRAAVELADRGYRVVNYDLRGHGESDWSPDGNYAITGPKSDLMTILKTVGRPVALVGASMGGMVSFYSIGSSPEPIADALVMVDIVLHPAKEGAARIRKFMHGNPDGFATLEEAADAVAAYNPDRPRPRDPSGLMKNLRLRDDGRLHWHWDPRMLRASPEVEPPRFGTAMDEVAPNVRLPVLLVRGGHSDIVDDAGVEEMRRLVPQTEVFDVAGAGHMVAGDRNDAFNQGVISFLERHMPPK